MVMQRLNEEEIFHAARRIEAPEARRLYLWQSCGDDAALQARVEALLRVYDEGQSFLGSPAPGLPATLDERPMCGGPGTAVGPYKLLEQVGEGGFGIVFMAEQTEPVRRKVALKVIKPGMDTRQVIARFEAERQALALMDHPNIAKVFDGGATASGRPYFVMELVQGTPITHYCDEHRLTPRERLGLFIQVCSAVQHAHQKGVIHRDLKPSNVLVTLHDGTSVVKVIDFGVAKALGQPLTDKTLYTGFAQLLGTPLYMSPEQAGQSGLDVDTRSDIYALGVLLYELLTGTTPFSKQRFKQAPYDEIRRILREEEPPRPSTRLSDSKEALPSISAQRHTEPAQLTKLVRGELDWIAMKALEKDRDRRYETASAFAADVQRYLADEPVLACPPSAWYRFRKFARRNKNPLVTVGLLTVTLVLAVVGLAISNINVNREKDRAEKALKEKEGALKAAEANLLLARQAVDEMYTKVAPELGSRPYMQSFQRDVLQKALRFYEQFAQRQSGDPAIRLETASARVRVGQVHYNLGQRRQAKRACDEAIAALEELGAELPAEPNRRVWLAAAYLLRGKILDWAYRPRQAAKSFRQALALHGELAAEQPDEPGHWSNLAGTHLALGSVLLLDRPGEAEKEVREGVRLYEKLAAEPRNAIHDRESLIGSYIVLGNFLFGVERYQEAERACRQAIDLCDQFGESLNRTAGRRLRGDAEFALGSVLAASGRREEAEKAYRRARAAAERDSDQFPDVPGYRQHLAMCSAKLAALLAQSGKRDEAAVFGRSARELFEKLAAESPDDEEKCVLLQNACVNLRDAGDLERAEQFGRQALTLAGKLAVGSTEPVDRQRVAESHSGLGTILQRRGRPRDAADQFRQAMGIYEQLAAEFPDEVGYRHFPARMLNFQCIALRMLPGEAAAALRYQQQAIALCDQLVAEYPDQPLYRMELVRSYFGLGIVLWRTGRPAEAVQALQQALDAHRPYSGAAGRTADDTQFASVHNELAWLLATWPDVKFRDPGRAVALARKAVALAPEKGTFWNTLGVAYYRACQWRESQEALEKSMKLFGGQCESFNTFFLAMTHWQLGEREESRRWYREAVAWMEKNKPGDDELRRFRAEAERLLQIHSQDTKDTQKNSSNCGPSLCS
jgi:serine/threonine protein kinase